MKKKVVRVVLWFDRSHVCFSDSSAATRRVLRLVRLDHFPRRRRQRVVHRPSTMVQPDNRCKPRCGERLLLPDTRVLRLCVCPVSKMRRPRTISPIPVVWTRCSRVSKTKGDVGTGDVRRHFLPQSTYVVYQVARFFRLSGGNLESSLALQHKEEGDNLCALTRKTSGNGCSRFLLSRATFDS